jgi:hypothetical protein
MDRCQAPCLKKNDNDKFDVNEHWSLGSIGVDKGVYHNVEKELTIKY